MEATLPHVWQEINGRRHNCHSWPDSCGSRIAAMTFLILLALVATALVVAALRLSLHDGSGPQRPPASHPTDPRFAPPAWR
jgi:hypothetical protein